MLKLYNTLTRSKEPFSPADGAAPRIYMCGPTVYDYAHIGNARAFVAFDLLYRVLRLHFQTVHYVRNITDIDDKIIDALSTGESFDSLTSRMTQSFHEDMDAIHLLRPDVEPRATEHILKIIEMIEILIEKRHGYVAGGHVLFDVPSFKDYGRLSKMNLEELLAGARVEVAPYKKNPSDFILWKLAEASEIGWPSPWGRGRPGWHIECSAMSAAYLGEIFDIHGGGQDLIFPHHENEIAQSACCFHGAPHARFWFHNGFLTINGTKMSKSLGNFYTVHQLLEEGWNGEAIRLALMTAHYRQPLDFTTELLRRSEAMLERWYAAVRDFAKEDSSVPPNAAALTALADDLNTPEAIAQMNILASSIFKETDEKVRIARSAELMATARCIGLMNASANEFFQHAVTLDADWKKINLLVEERERLRRARKFAEADAIRRELASEGIQVEDTADGPRWSRPKH